MPLKYLSDFWRILKNPLINCEINLDQNWSENCANDGKVKHESRVQIHDV